MKFKLFFFTSFILFFMFLGFFLIGIFLSFALKPVYAQEFMPYEVMGQNDTFKLIINTDQTGKATAFTYSYEYAD